MSIAENLESFKQSLPEDVTLVAVSKTKSPEEIMEAYNTGHRIFGENKVQEMVSKQEALPKDIEWHMIGHVQRNKVKYMAEFVSLIHSVDSPRLLREINKQAAKCDRVIDCLLQIKIAEEESKFGLEPDDVEKIMSAEMLDDLPNVRIVGLMGMATFTDDKVQLKREFSSLKKIFDSYKSDHDLQILSMGMSGDHAIAIQEGSNMVRVGSAIFGPRNNH